MPSNLVNIPALQTIKFTVTPLICVSDEIDKKEGFQFASGNQYSNNDITISDVRRIYAHILSIIFISSATLLAWDCNKNESQITRVTSTLFAAFFNFWYLLFYFIYRILMKNNCN